LTVSAKSRVSFLYCYKNSFAESKIFRIREPSLPPLPKSTIFVGYLVKTNYSGSTDWLPETTLYNLLLKLSESILQQSYI